MTLTSEESYLRRELENCDVVIRCQSRKNEINEKLKEIEDKLLMIAKSESDFFDHDDCEISPIQILICTYCPNSANLFKELPDIKPNQKLDGPICQECYFSCPVENGIRDLRKLDKKEDNGDGVNVGCMI
ncbi:11494_t:CDS:2 [Entrophospora sp. SA101]|nr:11494_t:CDS:2 [Entrophospora sp. SA101]